MAVGLRVARNLVNVHIVLVPSWAWHVAHSESQPLLKFRVFYYFCN